MTNAKLFNGGIAFVTGAGQGIGAALAKGLADAGCKVMVSDIGLENAQKTAQEIVAAGGTADAFALDVSDEGACRAVASEVEVQRGPISVLVNNAGVSSRGKLDDDSFVDDVRKTFEVNVLGTLNVTRAFRAQLKQTQGAVANLASLVSLVAGRATIPYGASKGAVAQMTRSLARDLGVDGIRVNAIAPGFTDTPLTHDLIGDNARLASTIDRTMLKRIGYPEDMVGPIVFLCSDMAKYVTGHILPVDGGYAIS